MNRQPSNPDPPDSAPQLPPSPALHRLFLSEDDRVRPIFRALLFLIVAYVLLLGAQRGVTLLLVFKGVHGIVSDWFLLAYYLSIDALLLIESWLFANMLDRRSFRTVGIWFYQGWGKDLARGVGLGAGLMTLVVAALFALRVIYYNGLAGSLSRLLPGLLLPGFFFLLAALFEEIACRGYAFQRLVDALGPVLAVVIFSGLFGVLHIRNPFATALSTANTVLAGVLFSVAYLKTRALWLPIGLHWAWNFFQGSIFSLGVSGLSFGPKLLRASFGGPDWLSGGLYGPEGSVVVTLAYVVAIVWLGRTRRVAPSPAMEEVLK